MEDAETELLMLDEEDRIPYPILTCRNTVA